MMRTSRKGSRGFTLIEILVAVLIISMAALPLIMLSRSDNFQTSFNDSYMIALTRAKRICAAFDAMGYDEVLSLSGLTTPGASCTLSSPLPKPEDELRQLALNNSEMGYLKHIEKKLNTISPLITLTLVENGILSLNVTMVWKIPGENAKLKEHRCNVVTFITNPDVLSTFGADN